MSLYWFIGILGAMALGFPILGAGFGFYLGIREMDEARIRLLDTVLDKLRSNERLPTIIADIETIRDNIRGH